MKELLKEIFEKHLQEGYNKEEMEKEYYNAIDYINECECECKDESEYQDFWLGLIEQAYND